MMFLFSFTNVCRNITLNISSNALKRVVVHKQYIRHICLGSVVREKLFQEYENSHAHNIMSDMSDKYSIVKTRLDIEDRTEDQFTEKLKNSWKEQTPTDILESFKFFSDYAHKNSIKISSEVFDDFIDALTDNLHKMSDKEIETVFHHFRKWPQTEAVTTRNFIEVWSSLDDTLSKRSLEWDTNKLLLFLDYTYNMNLSRLFKYTKYALNKLARRAKHLTAPQFVQTLFYISAYRKDPHEIFNLELKLNDLINTLSIDELAIVSMGFFKSKTTIKDPKLLDKIVEKLIPELNTINEISVCAILKILRYSAKRENATAINLLLDNLANQIPRLSFLGCLHSSLLGTTTLVKHTKLLRAVAHKFADDPSEARLKDLERLAFVFTLFNLESEFFMSDIILQQLRDSKRKDEIEKYPKCLMYTLNFLAINAKYSADLINKVLDPEFIKRAYGTYISPAKSLLTIDCAVSIDYKSYKGNHLDTKARKKIAREFCEYIPEPGHKYSMNAIQKVILEIILLLKEIRGGNKFVYAGHLLPHYDRGDIVVSNNPKGDPIRAENHFPKKEFGKIYRAPDNKNTWLAFVVVSRQGIIFNTGEPVGTVNMKLRHLKKLGYKPAMILWSDWTNCQSEEDKKQFLKNVAKSVHFTL